MFLADQSQARRDPSHKAAKRPDWSIVTDVVNAISALQGSRFMCMSFKIHDYCKCCCVILSQQQCNICLFASLLVSHTASSCPPKRGRKRCLRLRRRWHHPRTTTSCGRSAPPAVCHASEAGTSANAALAPVFSGNGKVLHVWRMLEIRYRQPQK